MDMTNVKFMWSSEEINARPSECVPHQSLLFGQVA